MVPLSSNSSQNVLPKKMGGHLGGMGGHFRGLGGHFRLFVCCLNLLIYVSNWSIMYVGWVLYHFYIFLTIFFFFLSLTLKIFKIEYFSKLSKQYIFFTIVSWFICQIKIFHTCFKSYFHIYSVNLMLFTFFPSLTLKYLT